MKFKRDFHNDTAKRKTDLKSMIGFRKKTVTNFYLAGALVSFLGCAATSSQPQRQMASTPVPMTSTTTTTTTVKVTSTTKPKPAPTTKPLRNTTPTTTTLPAIDLTQDLSLEVDQFFVTPTENGHAEFLDAIKKAEKSIHIKMFSLTDQRISAALIEAAKKTNIDIKVILNGSNLKNALYKKQYDVLLNGKVPVVGSSAAFSITHEKSMIVDGKTAFVTTTNMTKKFKETRGYGVITSDVEIVAEMEAVFAADWENAKTGQATTPPLKVSQLVWSPQNSRQKITSLIDQAATQILIQVENLGDLTIQKALIRAVEKRGVDVRIILPMCNLNPDPFHNYKYMDAMVLAGVKARLMPYPATPENPYIHAKMMLVDQKYAYLGSINFSMNSTQKAREVGLIFADVETTRILESEFQEDWARTVEPIKPDPAVCLMKSADI